MKTRIKTLIDKNRLNAVQFANEIGIAPSSLHHIVSGRNNPSLEVLLKILERYPQLNAEWLIQGKGQMYKPIVQGTLFDMSPTASHTERNNPSLNVLESNKPEEHAHRHTISDSHELKISSKPVEPRTEDKNELTDRKPEKVIIFYSDKTFEIYQPK